MKTAEWSQQIFQEHKNLFTFKQYTFSPKIEAIKTKQHILYRRHNEIKP